ncbi:MAG: hypothetical protein J0H01_06510 [Rhizobiales bacterium]|nr:hypothetical protein [Hyphomicrobiales bacterium]
MAARSKSGRGTCGLAVANASAILIAMVASGCVQAPTTVQVAAFGKAASAITTTLHSAEATGQELRLEQTIEAEACRFLGAGPPRLAVVPRRPQRDFRSQIELVEAIANYAEMLAKATDPAEVAKVEAASAKLATASSQFASAIPGFSSAPIVAPIATLMGKLGADLIEHDLRRRLRAVIESVNPRILEAAAMLPTDLEDMAEELRRSLVAWRGAKRCILSRMRSDPRMARHELYDRYREADRIAREYETRVRVLDQRGTALAKLAEVHDALLREPENIDAALASIQIYATQLLDIRKAVAALPKSAGEGG